jgi:hypothetical protein
MTVCPLRASNNAISRPMPRRAPVTNIRAILFLRCLGYNLFEKNHHQPTLLPNAHPCRFQPIIWAVDDGDIFSRCPRDNLPMQRDIQHFVMVHLHGGDDLA